MINHAGKRSPTKEQAMEKVDDRPVGSDGAPRRIRQADTSTPNPIPEMAPFGNLFDTPEPSPW